ncbi:NmrA family NAD(P)-binding protein [Thermopolyspora sp. NPDC052614]|uniref:NmrA family NAD(P)-binding protein n=1 Tax=Thermopolyspora sp. NPDC052614 TaxID=3155682 RepID=UPI003420AE07
MTVALIGATGTIGPHVVDALLARQVERRVLTRDAARARTVLAPGAEIRQTDITEDEQVAAGCAGARSVLLLTEHSRDMADLQLRIMRALRRLDITIVKISGTSSAIRPDGPYACRQHWEVETILRESGARHVILRPNAFMQTIIGQILLPSVRETGTIPNAIAESGISFVDARDVGECAATALTTDEYTGQTLVLTGSRPVTYAELAALISNRVGRPVDVRDITPADIRQTLVARGTPLWEAEHFEEMYALFRRGESEFVSGDVERITGKAPRNVEAYIGETVRDEVGAGVGEAAG